MLKGKLALITGATSGIGHATAVQLAERGCDLVLTGRRLERLEQVSGEIRSKYKVNVTTLAFDLSERKECEKVLAKADLSKLSILVNNAGLALGTDPVSTAKLDDWDKMIDTNVKGLLYVTRLCLPFVLKNEGHIVNVGSVAGRWTYPGGAVYAATKFAVRALTEGIRLDLLGQPIRVTNIEPGMVETEFSEVRFSGDKERAANVYKDMTPLTPFDIAETIVWTLDRPKHVNIQELVIYPVDQAGVGPYVHRKATRN
jgi:3-hydroxy acid dehydrogenase / malonic semialdehyde reductase